jgi:hypothetical protein
MRPFCFGNHGRVVAGVVSTGGLAALAVKVSRKRSRRNCLKFENKEK